MGYISLGHLKSTIQIIAGVIGLMTLYSILSITMIIPSNRNAETCVNQTGNFEWQGVNGKLYCLDNGKWIKAKESKE